MKTRFLAATVLTAAAATLLAGNAGAAGIVTGITVTAVPANHVGPCPVIITFTAKVTMNGPGKVVYKWERSDGAIDTNVHPPIVFAAAGTQAVNTTWKLGAAIPAFQPFNGWQKLRVLRPNQMLSDPGKFTINCQSPNHPPQGKPDLVPQLHMPMDGFVAVKNIGTANSDPSRLLLKCQRLTAAGAGTGGGCPMTTAPLPLPWHAGPGGLVLDVPNLAPGAVFPHSVPGWAALVFTPGTYQFTAEADSTGIVAESNEGNNTATSTLVKP